MEVARILVLLDETEAKAQRIETLLNELGQTDPDE